MGQKKKNRKTLLWIIFGVALLIRVGLIFTRWINPDEGAHMMDARLVLNNLLPIVDYESRQPLYVFFIAFLFKLFGIHFWVGRLVSVLSTMGTGLVLFLIGKRMFNTTVGLFSSVLFLFLPLELVWAVVVKTEPLAVFEVCVSIFFVLKTFDHTLRNTGWMIISGMFSALAFYSRQTTIYLPAIILFYFLLRRDMKKGQKFSYIFQYFLGYLAVCVAFGAMFIREMGLQGIMLSQLNPLNLVVFNLLHLFGGLPPEMRVAQSSGIRVMDQDLSITLTNWKHAFYFSLFILVGAFSVGVRAILGSSTNNRIREKIPEYRNYYLLLVLWIFFATLPYIAQTFIRGFYTQYYLELLPPLIILASVFFEVIYKKIDVSLFKFVGFSIASLYFLYLVQKFFWQFAPDIGVYMLIGALAASSSLYFYPKKWDVKVLFIINLVSVLVISVLYYSLIVAKTGEFAATLVTMFVLYFVVKKLTFRLMKYHTDGRLSSFVRIYIVIVAFVITAAYSGRYIGLQYQSVWSPQTVNKVSAVLREHGNPNDMLLSGGAVWGLERFYPFMGKTHPTEFLKQSWSDFEKEFQNDRPRFIIVDGYTEKKFQPFWDFIEKELQINYTNVAKVSGSRYPVTVYMLNENETKSDSFLVLHN